MRRTGRGVGYVVGAAWAGAALGAALGALTPAAPAGAAGAAGAAPAGAAAGCPETVEDSYGAGDEVTVVGYARSCIGDTADPATPPAVFGFLHASPCASVDLPYCEALQGVSVPSRGTPLGQFTLASTTADAERGLRMELSFELPEGLASGLYYLVVCQGACDTTASSGPATPLYVGVDPPEGARPVRHWPIDDPAVAGLADEALLDTGEGTATLTGAQARALTGITTVDTQATGSRRTPEAARHGWRPPGGDLAVGGAAALAAAAALLVVAGTWRRAGVRNPAVAGAGPAGSAPGIGAGHASTTTTAPRPTTTTMTTTPRPASSRRKQIRRPVAQGSARSDP
jgi:hypothetical protein